MKQVEALLFIGGPWHGRLRPLGGDSYSVPMAAPDESELPVTGQVSYLRNDFAWEIPGRGAVRIACMCIESESGLPASFIDLLDALSVAHGFGVRSDAQAELLNR